MKFLAVVLALVISAEGIKVKTGDESKEKEDLKWGWGNYYQWTTCTMKLNGLTYKCCANFYGKGHEVSDSKCR